MQTDILLKQLGSSLGELKLSIEKFEKHPSPSTQYAEQLYAAIANTNKLVSAYLVLKEKKDVAPDLDIHLKLMNVPTPQEKVAIVEPMIDTKPEETIPEVKKDIVVEPIVETKQPEMKQDLHHTQETNFKKTYPRINININDKFRFINELFKTNAKEYDIAIEQINAVTSLDEANAYLKGLKDIYQWDEENDMVKRFTSLTQKRFS